MIAIIGLLSAFAIPAFNSIGQARGATEAGFQISSAIELARSEAVGRNTFVWLGLQPETNLGSRDLRVGLVLSKDGTANQSQANLVPVTGTILIKQVALVDSPLGEANFTVGQVIFEESLTFSPLGEVFVNPAPLYDEGFPINLVLEFQQTRGDTLLTSNTATIQIDGSTGLPNIVRQ